MCKWFGCCWFVGKEGLCCFFGLCWQLYYSSNVGCNEEMVCCRRNDLVELGEFRQQVYLLCEDFWVVGDDVVFVEVVGVVFEGVYDIVCFGYQQGVGGDVLGFQVFFEEVVQVVGGYIGQVQGSGIWMVQVGVVFGYDFEYFDVFVQVIQIVEGEVGIDQGIGDFVVFVYVDVFFVQVGICVFGGGEEVVVGWVIDYCLGDDVVLLQGD